MTSPNGSGLGENSASSSRFFLLFVEMATEIDENHLQVSEIAGELDCLFCLKAKDTEPQQFQRARSRRFTVAYGND